MGRRRRKGRPKSSSRDEIPDGDKAVTNGIGSAHKNLPWVTAAVLIAVLAWLMTQMPSWIKSFSGSGMGLKYSRLITVFPVGGKVQVVEMEGKKGATIAKKDIRKGEIIMKAEPLDTLPNNSVEHEKWYPSLVDMLKEARSLQLSTSPEHEVPSVQDLVTAAVLLMELHKGDMSHWHAYIEALPQNVSQMAWYWSPEEVECTVPRLDGTKTAEIHQSRLRNFHTIFDPVWEKFALSMDIASQVSTNETEWAFQMIKTRAFSGKLIPIFDMANHDPTKSATVFNTPDGTTYLVATQAYSAGEEVYNNYNPMPPSDIAEKYGFVDPNAAFVNAPSITQDLMDSPNTWDIDFCVKNEMLFFGNVTERRVEAKLYDLQQTRYYKPFHPTELTYQCVRVLIQSEYGPAIAKYIAEKLIEDISVYEAMASAQRCQSQSGNFPMIKEVNAVTAKLLRGALEVAQKAARGLIEYPGIEYP